LCVIDCEPFQVRFLIVHALNAVFDFARRQNTTPYFKPGFSYPHHRRIACGIEALCEAEVRNPFEDIRLALTVVPEDQIHSGAHVQLRISVVPKILEPDSAHNHGERVYL
jgi:hypothetical protein